MNKKIKLRLTINDILVFLVLLAMLSALYLALVFILDKEQDYWGPEKVESEQKEVTPSKKRETRPEFEEFFVHATIYWPDVAQTDNTPYETASLAMINKTHPETHRWCALSRDFFRDGDFEFGDTVEVQGCNLLYDGFWIVQDIMGAYKTRKSQYWYIDRFVTVTDTIPITRSIDFLVNSCMQPVSQDSVVIRKKTKQKK